MPPYSPRYKLKTPRNVRRKIDFSKSLSASKRRVLVQKYRRLKGPGNTPIKRMGIKRTGAITSKSAGWIRARRKVKRKLKRSSVRRIFKGVERTYEFGNTVQTQYSAYLGHATCPPVILLRICLEAISKQLMIRAGNVVDSLRENFKDTRVGDEFGVTYRLAPDMKLQTDTFAITGPVNIQDIASKWMETNVFRYNNYGVGGAQNFMSDIEFHRMFYTPVGGSPLKSSEVNLKQYLMDIYAKSTLKVQNRSVNTANENEADDVDNVPLYGKTYSGNGLGTPFTTQGVDNPQPTYYKNFYAGTYDGVIFRSGDNVEELREPVRPQQFGKVKVSGKSRLEPGHIKTSKLVFKKKFYFGTIANLVIKLIGQRNPAAGEGAAPQQYLPFIPGYKQRHVGQLFFPGKFLFVGYEKIMEAASNNPVPMTLAFEHNLNISCVGVSKFTQITAPGFESSLAQVSAE